MTETSRPQSLGNRLYSGETSLPIVAHARWWYTASAVLLVIAIGALVFRGLHLGIEFTGGAELTARVEQTTDSTVGEVRAAVIATGIDEAAEPRVVVVNDQSVQVANWQPHARGHGRRTRRYRRRAGNRVGRDHAQVIGPSWGEQITRQALIGLSFFILAVGIFLALIYEWKMAAAALIALIHDIVATIGIYALVGFDVTPATVIGFLTILGYSLYDTVVIFDKVRENTKGITAQNQYTYAEAANLGLNQTLMRSINTVIIALLPIGSILFVGAGLLGAGTLKDLALRVVRRGGDRHVFVDLHRHPVARRLQEQGADIGRSRPAGRGKASGEGPRGDVTEEAVTAATVAAPGRSVQVAESGERRQPQRQTRSQRRGEPDVLRDSLPRMSVPARTACSPTPSGMFCCRESATFRTGRSQEWCSRTSPRCSWTTPHSHR